MTGPDGWIICDPNPGCIPTPLSHIPGALRPDLCGRVPPRAVLSRIIGVAMATFCFGGACGGGKDLLGSLHHSPAKDYVVSLEGKERRSSFPSNVFQAK
jgi:hypothetical protein